MRILAIADGTVLLADLVDHAHGLLHIDYSGAAYDEHRPMLEERLCDQALDAYLGELAHELVGPSGAIRARAAEDRLTCTASETEAMCQLGSLGEGSPQIKLGFSPDGRYLEEVTKLDVAGATDSWLQEQQTALDAAYARLRGQRCP